MRQVLLGIVMTMALVACQGSQAPKDSASQNNTNIQAPTLMQVVENWGDLDTFVDLVQGGDLAYILTSKGPYTVFAPANDAFAGLPPGTVDTWLRADHHSELQRWVKYHIVPGAWSLAQIKQERKLKTLEGQELTISIRGDNVYVDSALIQNSDISASNGLLHVINRPLEPEQPSAPQTKSMRATSVAPPPPAK